ncbi:MAG: primosomal protein N' [Planctomycetota bacterium]
MSSLFGDTEVHRFVRVAVERAVDQYPNGLTYAVPADLDAEVVAGARVMVPLGRGDAAAAGWVVDNDVTPEIDVARIKPIRERDPMPALPGELMELARWISGYYVAPIGMTLSAMLPAAVRKRVGSVSRTMVQPVDPPPPDIKLAPKQKQVMAWFAAQDAATFPIDERTVALESGLKTTGPIRRLVDKGLLETRRQTVVEADWSRQAVDRSVPDALTDAQRAVLHDLTSALDDGFSTHLLFGVTGAGKTEVYIRLLHDVVKRGKVGLMLVPEIALTPQTAGRLIGRFPDHRVAVLHSGLTAAQRHQQWAMVAANEVDVILGARSAVFAPVPDDRLGVIIVDEEHDSSYKQDQIPRYHGRDVAIRRAQLSGVPIVLGSATPSLESWFNATERGVSTLHRLAERAPGLRLPRVRIVDFAAEMKSLEDRRVNLIGPTLRHAIEETMKMERQTLLLLNRRGFANYIACRRKSCEWLLQCESCDVTMVYHLHRRPSGSDGERPRGYVQCHHCQSQQRLPERCPECGDGIVTFGLGTQRVEQELIRLFPDLRDGESLVRVDSDTMHRAVDFHDTLRRFGSGDIRVLVGTQMIAKGLDYPGVRLVGVINADTALNLPDFRAGERTFQLVNQVVGRCGRGRDPGLAIVQTFNPEDPAIVHACAHDFSSFAREEVGHRRMCGLPPITRMARLVVRDPDLNRTMERAKGVEASLRSLADDTIRIRPAAPCPIARIAGKHRVQIELLAPSAATMQQLLATARRHGILAADASLAVDVDPVAML